MSWKKCPNVYCTFEGTEAEVDDHFDYMETHGLHEYPDDGATAPLF